MFRKASATGCNPNMAENYSHVKSIFGGRLAPAPSGFRSALTLEEKPDKKPVDRSVPTHWVAEKHDRDAVSYYGTYLVSFMFQSSRQRRLSRRC